MRVIKGKVIWIMYYYDVLGITSAPCLHHCFFFFFCLLVFHMGCFARRMSSKAVHGYLCLSYVKVEQRSSIASSINDHDCMYGKILIPAATYIFTSGNSVCFWVLCAYKPTDNGIIRFRETFGERENIFLSKTSIAFIEGRQEIIITRKDIRNIKKGQEVWEIVKIRVTLKHAILTIQYQNTHRVNCLIVTWTQLQYLMESTSWSVLSVTPGFLNDHIVCMQLM